MQPQTQTSSVGSLDPQVVSLAKAIRQTESGGDFNAKGKSGEVGAYQFTKPTFDKLASKYNVPATFGQASPEQQNELAYKQIKEWKDKGYNPGQIASMWNAGEGEPDAYTGKFSTGKPSVGVNSYGVKFDVPAYAKSVATAYQTLKQGGEIQADPNNPSSTASTNPVQTPTAPQKDFLQKAGDVVNSIFPGKEVGQAIGTLGGLGYEKLKGLFGGQDNSASYDLSAPSPLQVGGDIAQGALMVGTGQPEGVTGLSAFGKSLPVLQGAESALGRIGQAGLIGAGFGATNALKEGKTNVGDIANQTALGGATGGALGGVGELLSKASEVLPKSITRKFLPGTNPKTVDYAINKGLGSPTKMLAQSDASIKELGNALGNELTDSKYAGLKVDGKALLNQVASNFSDSGMNAQDIVLKLKNLVPLKSNLVDKLQNGTITLKELHSLNSSLGNNTFKTVFDDPAVKAGKEIGSNIYHSISDYINNTTKDISGKSVTEPLFSDLSKEYQLNSALRNVIRRGEKARSFTLRDLVALTTGFSAGGPLGAGGAFLAEKALVNPTVNLKTAGLISSLGGKTAQQLGKGLLKPAINVLSK